MQRTKVTANSGSIAPKARRLIIVGILVAILGCLVLIQVGQIIQVGRLKRAASSIRVGDTRADVVKLLGKPQVTYTSGFPPAGGAPTVWGSCYGGSLNSLRVAIDGCICGVCGGFPQWYHPLQDTEDWPVVIEFDKNGVVLAVNP